MRATRQASKLTKRSGTATRTALIVCLPFLLGATVYRWIDSNGVVNYSQKPPRNAMADTLDTTNLRTNVITSNGREEPDIQQDAISPQQRSILDDIERNKREREEELARVRAENCEKSRAVLQKLQNSNRIKVRSRDGTERVVGEDERQQRIADAKDNIIENCSPAP